MAFELGDMVRWLRLKDGMSQITLADLLDRKLEGRSSVRSSKAAIRTAISSMETGARPVPYNYRVALASIFDIPPDWFRRTWDAENEFKEALDSHRSPRAPARKPSLKQVAQAFEGATMLGSLPRPDPAHLVASREPVLAEFVERLRIARPGVLVVEGLSGYGKSSFVSSALKSLERAPTRRLVVSVKCTGLTSGQIAQKISTLVASCHPELHRFDVEKVFEHLPAIVVLDDVDRIASASEDGGTPKAGVRLAEVFAAAFRKHKDLKVVLVVRTTSGQSANFAKELSLLTGDDEEQPFRLGPLTDSDVESYLKAKLGISAATPISFANMLGGDPLRVASLVKVASERRGATVPELLVDADRIALAPLDEDRHQELAPLLRSLMERSRAAFFTAVVLTFALGRLDLETIESAVDDLARDHLADDGLDRTAGGPLLREDSVRRVLAEMLAEFTSKDHLQWEMHSRVKSAFAVLLSERIGIDGMRLVHRRLALTALDRVTAVGAKASSDMSFTEHHSLLHHLISLYRLAPVPNEGRVLLLAKAESGEAPSEADLAELRRLLDSSSRLQDRGELANVTFAALMLNRVDIEGSERIGSRQFGDFELKLKMLTLFMTGANLAAVDDLEPLPELAQAYAAHLLLDVAVCASQSGLIDLAHKAIGRSVGYRPRSAGEIQRLILTRIEAGVPDGDSELTGPILEFSTDSEHLNVYATVLLREGRISDARVFIGPYSERAAEIYELLRSRRLAHGWPSGKNRRPTRTLLIACRRLAAKRAQLELLSGERAEARRWFELSSAMDALHEPPPRDVPAPEPTPLGGDTGRAYCTLLIHGGDAEALRLAERIVEHNLEKAKLRKRYYEVVDWMVLQASLQRLGGDLVGASATLKAASRDRTRPGVNISFASSVTLALEQERQKVRHSSWRGVSRRLLAMQEQASVSKHALLSCDVALLLAESALDQHWRRHWCDVARRIVQRGYGFRRLDVERIEQGGPFNDLL